MLLIHSNKLRRLMLHFLLASYPGGCITPGDGIDPDRKVEVVTGHFEDKFAPRTAPNKIFDARGAEFFNYKVKWGMIYIKANPLDIGMQWHGGYVYTNKPWDASWDDHKDLDGPTRNSAAITLAAINVSVEDLYFFNVHDGVQTSESMYWIVADTWGEYVRDDCIENDHLYSGRIYDCLFDGIYTGISTRPSEGANYNGQNQVIELENVLIRLEPMPYPYSWENKDGFVGADGEPFNGVGVPFGHGAFFKLTDVEHNPRFRIKNCVFVAAYLTDPSNFDFPPARLIDVCENNTIVWLGPGKYPGYLPTGKFPNGFIILTGDIGRDFWCYKVRDWHARHPDVGKDHKPAVAGDFSFPRVF